MYLLGVHASLHSSMGLGECPEFPVINSDLQLNLE